MAKTQVNRPVATPTENGGVGVQVNRPVAPARTEDSPRNTKRNQTPSTPTR